MASMSPSWTSSCSCFAFCAKLESVETRFKKIAVVWHKQTLKHVESTGTEGSTRIDDEYVDGSLEGLTPQLFLVPLYQSLPTS